MLKKLFIIFDILILIFLMLLVSLYNGFKIDTLSYKNINIQGLYLKYDKKLIIETKNVSIGYLFNTKSVNMKIKISIKNLFDNPLVSIKKCILFDPYLKISGKFRLNLGDISLNNISNLNIKNFSLQFNKNLKSITADNCFVTFKNNNFYFIFKKPTYNGVNLDGSKATIVDFDRLKLELNSKDKLKKPLLKLLSNYKITLPLAQEYGKNSISTKLIIPFDIKKELKIQSKIDIKNSKIFLYNIPLYVKNFNLLLKNNILQGFGTLQKKSDDNSSLRYNLDTRFDIDFHKKSVKGDFNTKDLYFKDITLKNMQGDFNSDFSDKFISNIFIKNGIFKLKDEKFLSKNLKIKYANNDKIFYSTVKLKSIHYPMTMKISNKFNLLDLNSSGKVHFDYKDDRLHFLSNKTKYKIDFNDGVKVDLNLNELSGKVFKKDVSLQNGKFQYRDKKIYGTVDSVELNSKFIQLGLKNIAVNYNIKNENAMNIKSNNSKFLVNDIAIGLKKNILHIKKNSINIESFIENKYVNATINSNINVRKKSINGDILLSKFENKKQNNFKFDINYQDDLLINIPKLKFHLKKDSDNNSVVSINNFLPLKNYFDFFGLDKKSKLLLKRDDNANTNINLDHISMVLDPYYDNLLQKDKEKQNITDKIHLYWKNSFIEFNNFKFYFDTLHGKILNNKTHLELQKNTTKFSIDKINNRTIVKSKRIDADYVNLIVGKKVLKNGYLDMFLTGGLNKYQGRIKLYDTTIVKMQLIDNLLLFLNSTPALINPLFIIPTIYHFTQSNFELGGYYITKGLLNFNYNHLNRYLDIHNIITKGKINDFKGDMKLNFMNNTIKGNLQVSTLKDYAKIVNNIPLINYLFLDKEGKFSIPISIYGTIDNPHYKVLTNK